eukprot:TRINITY_DN2812_c0_g1_i1.p1 TRINITY_DN2812_c0_g1~~TRINITY_DN2812_c0_g1_i1.p1  ORF type:complete len:949 (+),score=104.00 TRINITY_DN2812_c0_g1_i1:57-2849(+)
MGACCGKGSEGRRLHVKKLVKHAKEKEGMMVAGTNVMARWGGGWYQAIVCVHRGDEVDVSWADGSVSNGVSRKDIQRLPVYRQGEMVEARWGAEWQPAAVIQRKLDKYEVEWADGSCSESLSHSDIRKPSKQPSPFPRRMVYPRPQVPRIHGTLCLIIEEARDLPDSDTTLFCGKKPGDPYCEVCDGSGRIITKTAVRDNVSNPKWNHRAAESGVVVPDTDLIHFVIKDEDVSGNEIVCETVIGPRNGLEIIAGGRPFAGWIPLHTASGHPAGELKIWMAMKPPDHPTSSIYDVQGARFPLTHSNKVTLYQSAHIGRFRDILASVPLYERRQYRREDCWLDLTRRILQAKHFIYVMGWSVDVTTRLVREKPIVVEPYGELPMSMTIGEMLVKKANEGCTVCVMVWKEATSMSGPGTLIENEGVAGTKSGQTIEYFRKTSVKCVGVVRQGASPLASLVLTHHQKGVMTDAECNDKSGRRRVVAFIGGLDLTAGRWDTPGKELFKTLGREHSDDFYQTMTTCEEHQQGPMKGLSEGPRQPWEDIHCQIEGPAAHDIVENFENRWRTQAFSDDSLYNVASSGTILERDEENEGGRGHDAWDVQVFRSIDKYSDSTVRGIEADCHQGWIKAIEQSKSFIYIENQFFMGASDKWLNGNNKSTSWNRIPDVIISRITAAIKSNAPFTAYIVLPMFPEGDPASRPVQEMLYWQYQTIAAMYHYIGLALKEQKSPRLPTDYLNFYCLGQKKKGEAVPAKPLKSNDKSRRALVLENGRMPIYVHSKMLIVDDEYIIIGSCNVNDRSMAGDRDTEIAVGMYQPAHSRVMNRKPHGVVHSLRLSLWSEHLCLYKNTPDHKLPKAIFNPSSLECVNYVNQRATRAWDDHVSSSASKQICHLMKYPYAIRANGDVKHVQKRLPDAKGLTLGKSSRLVPDWLTA